VADTAFAQQLRSEQGEQGLQRRDLLGAWPTGVSDGGGQVELEQLWQEQKQAGSPTQEVSADGRWRVQQRRHGRHVGAIFGPRLGRWRRRPWRWPVGQAEPLQQAKEIGLTEVVSFAGQLVADARKGIAEPA
jgi:hypothetical protein